MNKNCLFFKICYIILTFTCLGSCTKLKLNPPLVQKKIYFHPELDLAIASKLGVSYTYPSLKNKDIFLAKQAAKYVFQELSTSIFFDQVTFWDNQDNLSAEQILNLATQRGFETMAIVSLNKAYFEGSYLSDTWLEEKINLYFLNPGSNLVLAKAYFKANGYHLSKKDLFIFSIPGQPASSLAELMQTNAKSFYQSLRKQLQHITKANPSNNP